ncbi:MAG: cupin domain-containing protein [Gammaproteobacteria bacterium]|nr:cupin domain-containing protein [Gammaproteobacteria bacterium]MDH3857975.1 cupin domain-containing protein [Gammaproteobacteria bacterium]
MHKYGMNELQYDLEPWPFDNPASDYKILRGTPRASGRLDHGANGGPHRLGIWSCTEGAFECTELGDELQTIIRGRLTLTRTGGETFSCGPGDSVFTRKGERVIWDISEEVTKVFFADLN